MGRGAAAGWQGDMVPKGVIRGGGITWRQPPPPQRLAGGWAPLGVHGRCGRGAIGRKGRKQKGDKVGSLGLQACTGQTALALGDRAPLWRHGGICSRKPIACRTSWAPQHAAPTSYAPSKRAPPRRSCHMRSFMLWEKRAARMARGSGAARPRRLAPPLLLLLLLLLLPCRPLVLAGPLPSSRSAAMDETGGSGTCGRGLAAAAAATAGRGLPLAALAADNGDSRETPFRPACKVESGEQAHVQPASSRAACAPCPPMAAAMGIV